MFVLRCSSGGWRRPWSSLSIIHRGKPVARGHPVLLSHSELLNRLSKVNTSCCSSQQKATLDSMHTLLIRILSTRFTSVSSFSVCWCSRYSNLIASHTWAERSSCNSVAPPLYQTELWSIGHAYPCPVGGCSPLPPPWCWRDSSHLGRKELMQRCGPTFLLKTCTRNVLNGEDESTPVRAAWYSIFFFLCVVTSHV